jgi:hypothetical protein
MNFAKTSLPPGMARTECRGRLKRDSLLVGSDQDRGLRRKRPAFVSRTAFSEADGRYGPYLADIRIPRGRGTPLTQAITPTHGAGNRFRNCASALEGCALPTKLFPRVGQSTSAISRDMGARQQSAAFGRSWPPIEMLASRRDRCGRRARHLGARKLSSGSYALTISVIVATAPTRPCESVTVTFKVYVPLTALLQLSRPALLRASPLGPPVIL